jgi:predicted nucleic acid-binding protein
MILVDSSIWIDHIRKEVPGLSVMLGLKHALTHPFVIGEVALGSFKNRQRILSDLADLPKATVADDSEVMSLIERQRLNGSGLGFVDCHVIASALMSGAELWSRDKKLAAVADRLGIAYQTG